MYRVVICNTVRLVLTARMLGDFLPKLAFLDNVLRAGLRAEVRSVAASQKSFYYKMLEEDRDRAKNPEEQPSADVMDVLLNVQDPSGEALKDKKIVAMVRVSDDFQDQCMRKISKVFSLQSKCYICRLENFA